MKVFGKFLGEDTLQGKLCIKEADYPRMFGRNLADFFNRASAA
jgi:hypothetical protein